MESRYGAIILCGGKSSRMGRDKANLPVGSEAMLQRVVRLLQQAVEPTSIVIVAAKDQELPSLSNLVTVLRDQRPHRGPLEGLAGGLRGLPTKLDAVYCTSCDVPFLVPAFVMRMFSFLEDFEIAVPIDGLFPHPLAAVYRPRLLPVIEGLLAKEQLRPRDLFDIVPTRRVPVDQLREVDPNLRTLVNVNSPDEYRQALADLKSLESQRKRVSDPFSG